VDLGFELLSPASSGSSSFSTDGKVELNPCREHIGGASSDTSVYNAFHWQSSNKRADELAIIIEGRKHTETVDGSSPQRKKAVRSSYPEPSSTEAVTSGLP
jgi:hypothetical protein